MRLDEALEHILTTVESRLRTATEGDGLLSGVEEIVRGDRARPRPATPAVWIFAETANPDHGQSSLHEMWRIPIVLTPIVKSDNPTKGYSEATRLAARARSVILNDKQLGSPSLVRDIKSGRFECSAPWHNDGNLYSAVAVIDVVFILREQCKKEEGL